MSSALKIFLNSEETSNQLIDTTIEVAKRNQPYTFKVIRKIWVVEIYFAWLEKCRRLWKNCERHISTSLTMVVLAFAALLLKRF